MFYWYGYSKIAKLRAMRVARTNHLIPLTKWNFSDAFIQFEWMFWRILYKLLECSCQCIRYRYIKVIEITDTRYEEIKKRTNKNATVYLCVFSQMEVSICCFPIFTWTLETITLFYFHVKRNADQHFIQLTPSNWRSITATC